MFVCVGVLNDCDDEGYPNMPCVLLCSWEDLNTLHTFNSSVTDVYLCVCVRACVEVGGLFHFKCIFLSSMQVCVHTVMWTSVC